VNAVDVFGAPSVDRFLAGIEAGSIPVGIFSDDAILDATVPNWRFSVNGGEAVRHELGRWYADPGRFESLRRTPLPDGELVEFTLAWEEQGGPHACHQAHILKVAQGQVAGDTAFCGGRWPAALLAEMQAAG
jgi:hypothetical protein